MREETDSDVHYARGRRELGFSLPQVSRTEHTETPDATANGVQNPAKTLEKPTKTLQSPAAIAASIKLEPDLISLLDARITAISHRIAETTDTTELEELIKTERLLRRYRKDELSARRLRLRHLRDKRSPKKGKSEGEPNAKQTEGAKLFEFLQQVASAFAKGLENPTPNAALQTAPPESAQPPWPPASQPPHFGDTGFPVQSGTHLVRRRLP